LCELAFKNAYPNAHRLSRAALFGFEALQVVIFDMDSTYLRTLPIDRLEHKDPLGRRAALHFALLQLRFAPGDVSKYQSCIHDEESATSGPYFRALRVPLPRPPRDLRAFLYSHNDVTPGGKSNKGSLEGVGVKATASAEGTQVISAGNDSIAHAVAQSPANLFQTVMREITLKK
jgi:hypothetical protein